MRRGLAQTGFSLIEALIAMVLMAAMLAALSTMTAQWLPNWNRGFVSIQNEEILQRGLERLIADLSAAEYIPSVSGDTQPLFIGTQTSITFVRRSLGPNTAPGLEIVHIEQKANQTESTLVRTRARFTPVTPGTNADLLPALGDGVVVMRSPYRLTFSYSGDDRSWHVEWQNTSQLPRAIRLTIYDTVTGRALPLSTVAVVHVDAAPHRQDNDPSGRDRNGGAQSSNNSPLTQEQR
jgi:general secretion pathway protein J